MLRTKAWLEREVSSFLLPQLAAGRGGKTLMSLFFEDRSAGAYRRAAEAVQRGNATPQQREMNDRAAKQAGRMGNDARAAQKGELKK